MDLQMLIGLTKFEHSRKVSAISAMLAEMMGYSHAEIEIIRQASLYHDIGKVDISPEILNKPGALTAQEFEIIKRHTQTGCEKISEAICVLITAYWITRHHHERGDGTGYYGLTANEIHPFIRLVSVADVLDALLSKRSYKQAWGLNEALDYLKNQSGVQFDKEVISVLLDRSDDIADLYR